ncbi:MAG: glycosyltransferase family 2 protein [Gammaproteobacteria bacterium]
MTAPRVSVLVTNYNYAGFLDECVASVQAQTFGDFEIVIVDDGSRDDSWTVIEALATADPARIVPLRQDNAGQAAAFNAGFAASRGAVVAFLDADDTWLPDKLAATVAAFDTADDVVMVQHYLDILQASDGDYPFATMPPELPASVVLEDYFVEHSTDYFAATSGISLRRDVLARMLPLETSAWRLCADICISRPAPLFGRVVTLAGSHGHYRIHGHNNWMGGEARADFCRNYRERVAFTNAWLARQGERRRVRPLLNPLYRRRLLRQTLRALLRR